MFYASENPIALNVDDNASAMPEDVVNATEHTNHTLIAEEIALKLQRATSKIEVYATKQANEIAAQMKHACSWITIKVAGDDVTANNWTLNSLVVKTLKHSGSVDCGSATASWTLTGEKTDEVYYDAGTTFTKEYVKYEKTANNFIVLPQTPTSLDVTYTYTSQEATGTTPAITLTETKNVPLTLINSLSVWSPGIHYIYNVMITATEILIDPVVVEWTEHANNPLQKEVN
jgi:hypothetical protein